MIERVKALSYSGNTVIIRYLNNPKIELFLPYENALNGNFSCVAALSVGEMLFAVILATRKQVQTLTLIQVHKGQEVLVRMKGKILETKMFPSLK